MLAQPPYARKPFKISASFPFAFSDAARAALVNSSRSLQGRASFFSTRYCLYASKALISPETASLILSTVQPANSGLIPPCRNMESLTRAIAGSVRSHFPYRPSAFNASHQGPLEGGG